MSTSTSKPLSEPIGFPGTDDEMLQSLQQETFHYFVNEVSPHTGLVADSSREGSPSSIAATGFAMAVYIVGIERGFIDRADVFNRIVRILHFFENSHQGPEPDATGYKGFYYHFLDEKMGKRTWDCEVSTIDTTILLMGFMVAAAYFDSDDPAEVKLRKHIQALYERVDWQWACNGQKTVTHGWKPETGFLEGRWNEGYSEAHILYMLALASPTFPVSVEGYTEWTKSFKLKEYYGIQYLYAGPLFIHQFSQLFLDMRGMRDEVTRKIGFDYFENSRRATCAQRAYAIENPLGFAHYGKCHWGITATDGPGPAVLNVKGVSRKFYNYIARGAPGDIDDGTISPWVIVTSIPFAPEIVIETMRVAIKNFNLQENGRVTGFVASINATFPEKTKGRPVWVSESRYALNQGPLLLMVENHRTGLLWSLLKKNETLSLGLQRAGFRPAEDQQTANTECAKVSAPL